MKKWCLVIWLLAVLATPGWSAMSTTTHGAPKPKYDESGRSKWNEFNAAMDAFDLAIWNALGGKLSVLSIYSLTSSTPTPAVGTAGAEIRYYLGTDGAGTNTGLANTATFGAPTGTPINGQKLLVTIFDNATPQTLAWNSGAGGYLAGSIIPLPTTTVSTKVLPLAFIYNSYLNKWLFVGYAGGF